jgi:S1-C subfamily serine protease
MEKSRNYCLIVMVFTLYFLSSIRANSQTIKSYDDCQKYFVKNYNTIDRIEGIWSFELNGPSYYVYDDGRISEGLNYSVKENDYQVIVIIKEGTLYNAYYYMKYSYTYSKQEWLFNSLYFSKTSSNDLYKYELDYKGNIFHGDTKFISENQISFNFNFINEKDAIPILGRNTKQYRYYKLTKISPNQDEIAEYTRNIKPSNEKTSGTGFALTSNGIIITNFHVIDGATTITINGVGGDFSYKYSAKLLAVDIKNDLALLKIDDAKFETSGNIPYSFKTTTTDVGSNIFDLGYPLRASMGDEIKLTNGIISAKSGFQGDITSYQISAPIQPGNSGAPLFDKNGYVIGIVNAKIADAENVGYAIKTSYLINLIESLTPLPKMTTQNLLIGKPLTEQVKLIKKFVYIIEAN